MLGGEPLPAMLTQSAPILWGSLFILGLGWLGWALGLRILRWFGVPDGKAAPERAVIALTLGIGCLQFVPFALGAFGVLGRTSVVVALGVVALALLKDFGRVIPEAGHLVARLRGLRGWRLAALLALAPAVVVSALLALCPTLDPDGLTYHLTVPKRWTDSGSFSYLPTYPYANMPMGVETLFLIALVFAGDSAAKLVHFSLGLLATAGLYVGGKRLANATVGYASAAVFLVGPFGASTLLGQAYCEGVIASTLVGASLAWATWYTTRNAGWLRCAALLAGIALTFKITTAPFAVGLGIITLLTKPSEVAGDGGWLSRKSEVVKLLLLLCVPVLPWLVRSAVLTGNPVFPILAGVIPTRDLSGEHASGFNQYNRYFLWATRMGYAWDVPTRRLILLAVAALLVAAAGVAWFRLRSQNARFIVVTVLAGLLAQLAAVGLYIRYWTPMLAVIQLALLVAGYRLIKRPWPLALVVGLVLLGSLRQAKASLATVSNDASGLVRSAIGLDDPRAFLRRHLPLYPLYERVNRDLPADSHVLLSYYCGGFYVDRTTFCTEFIQDSLRFTTYSEFVDDLRRLRITHVLAPTSLATGGPQRPPPLSATMMFWKEQDEFFARLLKGHARLLESSADQGLYELDQKALRPL